MESLKPKVSIITICLNSIDSLEKTILSVLRQTYKNIEYIIIDGGSTDGSVEIIKRYERKIAYWVSESDRGISEAFNKGIKASTGYIIGILNAGDRYLDETVEKAVTSLGSKSAYHFVFGDLIYNDASGEPKFVMKADKNYADKIRFTMPALNHPTVIVKKEVYEECGLFDTAFKIAMDYEFFLRITLSGKKGLYIEEPLADMEYGGISYSSFYKSYREVLKASIMAGYNPVKANIRLYLKGARGIVRVVLEKFKIDFLIRILGKLFWNIENIGDQR
jgi:glycosyltransferase involved in cell wall biosynthesis